MAVNTFFSIRPVIHLHFESSTSFFRNTQLIFLLNDTWPWHYPGVFNCAEWVLLQTRNLTPHFSIYHFHIIEIIFISQRVLFTETHFRIFLTGTLFRWNAKTNGNVSHCSSLHANDYYQCWVDICKLQQTSNLKMSLWVIISKI